MKRFLLYLALALPLFVSCGELFGGNNNGGEEPQNSNNQLKYTTVDGKPVELNMAEGFDAEVVSNVYENGVGIITFDRDIAKVGDSAFMLNSTLESIVIPDGVTTIGARAFHSCVALSYVELGAELKVVEEDACLGCWDLATIELPYGLEIIGDGAFQVSGLESIDIPNSVVEIGNGAFGTLLLQSVVIPSSVQKIGRGAFQKCSELISADIGCSEIEPYAFYECTKLSEVKLRGGVKSIGEYAFNATSIQTITLPESVEAIGNQAFIQYYDSSIPLEVFCRSTTPPTAIRDAAGEWRPFEMPLGDDVLTIYVPTSAVDAYKKADGWDKYASRIIGYDSKK